MSSLWLDIYEFLRDLDYPPMWEEKIITSYTNKRKYSYASKQRNLIIKQPRRGRGNANY